MQTAPKKPKRQGLVRQILAVNIAAQLARQYPGERVSNAEKKLASAAGVGHGTVQRMRKAQAGSSIDNIEFVAEALNVSVTYLLTPSEATKRALNLTDAPTVRHIRRRVS